MSERTRPFHFLVPGSIERRTGGSVYDRRIAAALPAHGWTPIIEELDGAFPATDTVSAAACRALFGKLPDDARLLVDGLVLPAVASMLPERPATSSSAGVAILCHHPVVLEPGWSDRDLTVLRRLEAAGFERASMIISPSRQTLVDVEAQGYSLRSGRVVNPGSDPASPGPKLRTAPGRPARLLCVASLTPRKGHDVLLEALLHLADLDLQLACVGAGTASPGYAAEIKEKAGNAAFHGRVSFAGDIDPAALEAEYAAADIFVLASRHEGFGMVFSEALRRGLPLIGTRAGAIPEAAPAGASTLVPPDDPVALAAAIRELVTDPEIYASRASAAHAAAKELPDWHAAAAEFAAALDDVWGNHE